jgi:hypothetical protein
LSLQEKEILMRVLQRRSLVLGLFLALLGVGAFWATATLDANPQRPEGRATLPKAEVVSECSPEHTIDKVVVIPDEGSFKMAQLGEAPPMVAVTGKPFISRAGLKTVPLQIIAISGRSFAEGLGESHFWLDATRPMQSAIWEKTPGTEFPAVQEVRFHFFFTMESKPGKLFRTMNPAIMRSTDVASFPPPPGTVYRLMQKVNIEDVNEPGVVAAQVVSNRVVIRKPGRMLEPRESREF